MEKNGAREKRVVRRFHALEDAVAVKGVPARIDGAVASVKNVQRADPANVSGTRALGGQLDVSDGGGGGRRCAGD